MRKLKLCLSCGTADCQRYEALNDGIVGRKWLSCALHIVSFLGAHGLTLKWSLRFEKSGQTVEELVKLGICPGVFCIANLLLILNRVLAHVS